jgi:hypothetical protein
MTVRIFSKALSDCSICRRWVSGISSALVAAAVTSLLVAMVLLHHQHMEGQITSTTTVTLEQQETIETVSTAAATTVTNGVLQMTASNSCAGREQDELQQQQQQRQLQDDDDDDTNNNESFCDDVEFYISRTLKLVHELPFASVFDDAKGQRRFDASSIVLVDDTYAYTVYDNSYTIGKVAVVPSSYHLEPFSQNNIQILARRSTTELQNSTSVFADDDDDSRFEAILHHSGDDETGSTFIAIQESSVPVDQNGTLLFHAMFVKLSMTTKNNNASSSVETNADNAENYEVIESCPSEFVFHESRGISGAVALPLDGRRNDTSTLTTVLALCSVNHCDYTGAGGGEKDDPGNGRVIVMTYMPATEDDNTSSNSSTSTCQWKAVGTITIPASANFSDYSDLAMTATGRVAITSRTASAVWIGQLLEWQALDELAFDENVGQVYSLPRGKDCEKVYCTVDGVEWLNDDMLLMVSDKMRDDEDFWCHDKDQSLHLFAFPDVEEDESEPNSAPPTADPSLFSLSNQPGDVSSPSSARNNGTLSGLRFLFCIVLFYSVSVFIG